MTNYIVCYLLEILTDKLNIVSKSSTIACLFSMRRREFLIAQVEISGVGTVGGAGKDRKAGLSSPQY